MNNPWNKLKSAFLRKRSSKSLIISVVILFEVIALLVVATFAWVETVSSIKIATNTNGQLEVDTFVFTEATIGEGKGTIDLADYFKQGGDMHFAPASSTDGRTLFFPKVTSAGTAYVSSGTGRFRKSSTSDMNTNYISITFKVKAETNADFFFDKVPDFSEQSANMRVSVTAQTMGSTANPETTIYKMANESAETCVNTVDGGTASVTVKKIEDHIKGKTSENRLFAVGAEETKIVTINVWLSGTTLDSTLPKDISISNFGITSNLTPRRVTLIPTSRWDDDGGQTFYAWCWAANNNKSRLYKLSLDQETEHYCFDYNGSYTQTTFIRAVSGCTVEEGEYTSWPFSNNSTAANTNGCLKQTVDTSIPNKPLDPTFAIDTYSGGKDSKSTGVWADPDLVTYKLAYATGSGQGSACGTLSATTYIGTTTSTNVMETTNISNSNALHHNTIHALPGNKVKLTATPNTDYAFVGWYTNAACTGSPLSSNEFLASSNAPIEITYYAKFKPVRTITINKILDGNESSTAGVGSMTITNNDDNTSATESDGSVSKTVDYGANVSLSATAGTGYTLSGIYTTKSTGGSEITAAFDANVSQAYYARFTTNEYDVTANARYTSTVGGTSYSTGNTGGTVQVGTSAASSGTTYTSTQRVKYKSSVELKASPASGYVFVGWYDGNGNLIDSSATTTTYNYTLNNAGAVNVYGRFMKTHTTSIYVTPRADWGNNYYVRLYQGSGTNVISSNNGFVQAEYDTATGYYKANFTTTKTGTFYAILAKDSNHTDKVPSTGGYQGDLGTSYRFKKGTEGLATYNNDRCIWFIDGSDSQWIVSDCNLDQNNSGTLIRSYYSSLTTMTKINSNCWIYEYSGLTNGDDIYFNQNYKDNITYEKNHWKATVTEGKNQYTATVGAGHDNYGTGSWTN